MTFKRGIFCIAIALLYLFPGIFAGAQVYTSIVVIGDSLSDTGNDANVSGSIYGPSAQIPGPNTGYTLGRFTDGSDTMPQAQKYYGVWIEQLAAMLAAKPPVVNSLTTGGTNYAYGFATTNTGTSSFTYGPGNALAFPVVNMGQQLSTYLATNPTITSKTLFVVWGGANDLIAAVTAQDIQNAAMRDAGIVQELISAGATDIIVPNLPPLGLVPRYNGSPTTSIPATTAATGYDQALAYFLSAIPAANPGKTLHIFQLDTYTLFNTIVAAPSAKGFANVTAMSQGNTAINPDTYLFWDSLHPTTYGHSLIAAAAYTLIGTPVATATSVSSTNLNANLNASVTLTASVSDASGTPTGTVTFMDGSTVLGTGYVTGSSATATTTFTTTALTAGTHTITAQFAGVNGYTSSSSAGISEIVTAPALTSSFMPSSITIAHGGSATANLVLNPVGGYTGTVTIACGTLPAHFSCVPSPASVTLTGNNAQQTLLLALGTVAMSSASAPSLPGSFRLPGVLAACVFFPCFGLVAVRRKKLGLKNLGLFVLLVTMATGATLGMTGCGNSSNNTVASGTYTIQAIVTANGTSTTNNLTVNVQ